MRGKRRKQLFYATVMCLAAMLFSLAFAPDAWACHTYVSSVDGTTGCGAWRRDGGDEGVSPTTTRYEAEAGSIYRGTRETAHRGYTGSGYVDDANAVGGYVEWSVNAPAAVRVTLDIRYANGSTAARPTQVRLNSSVIGELASEPTGGWTNWSTQRIAAVLEPGANIVRVSGVGSAGMPNIDHLAVTRTSAAPAWAASPSAQRIQWHGNGHRGIAYHDYDGRGQSSGSRSVPIRVQDTIALDGDRSVNVRGNVFPIDVDGDGRFEFVHVNGFRTIRVLSQDKGKLWESSNPLGRVHRTQAHRDTIAIYDVDSDGKQEILHCWEAPDRSSQILVLRDGADGRIRRSVRLTNPAREECQIALYRFEGRSEPLLLVSHRAPSSAGCNGNWVDYLAKVVAFDMQLNVVWERVTCDAGHYFFGIDEDEDGAVEGVFAGKYRLDRNGDIVCRLAELGGDHVDSAQIGDLVRAYPGHEMVAIGQTGTRLYSVNGCRLRWHVRVQTVPDPQQLAVGRFYRSNLDPVILVETKAQQGVRRSIYVLTSSGSVFRTLDVEGLELGAPFLVTDLDGSFGRDEFIIRHCIVIDIDGTKRTTRDWYWNLQTLSAAERQLHPNEQWATACLTFDVDADGREEMVVWGRQKIVIGSPERQ